MYLFSRLGLSRALFGLSALFLTACANTGGHGTTAYKKPPLIVPVGEGPNREIAVQAMKYLGTPYHFGGSSPEEGFDCSGLVQWSAKNAKNFNVPRATAQQSAYGQELKPDEIKAGDLVFFNITSQPNTHVGIYLGDTFFVHSPSTNGVVRVDSLTNPYWQPRVSIARRLQ